MKPLVFLVLINNVSSSSVVRSDSDIITLLFWVLPIDHNIQSCTKIYITLSIQHKPYRVTLSCIYAPDKIICQRTCFKSYTNVPIFFNIFNYSSCQWIMLKIVILVESIVYRRKLTPSEILKFFFIHINVPFGSSLISSLASSTSCSREYLCLFFVFHL